MEMGEYNQYKVNKKYIVKEKHLKFKSLRSVMESRLLSPRLSERRSGGSVGFFDFNILLPNKNAKILIVINMTCVSQITQVKKY